MPKRGRVFIFISFFQLFRLPSTKAGEIKERERFFTIQVNKKA
jgi:hypothetical protein